MTMPDLYATFALASVVGLLLFTSRWVKRRDDAHASRESADLRPSELPEPPVVATIGPTRALAPRENRALVVRERTRQRTCTYCDDAAVVQKPVIVQERSFADRLYVALGATPPTRWRVNLYPDGARHPESLCNAHAEIVRGRFERFVADKMAEQAAFVGQQQIEVFEFERHVLDEEVGQRMTEILKRKPGGG